MEQRVTRIEMFQYFSPFFLFFIFFFFFTFFLLAIVDGESYARTIINWKLTGGKWKLEIRMITYNFGFNNLKI